MPPLLSPRPDGGRGVQREGGRIGVGMSARDALTAACKASNTHLHTVCLFSLNKPPMRPKVREPIVFLLSDRALLSRARSQLPCPALSLSPSSLSLTRGSIAIPLLSFTSLASRLSPSHSHLSHPRPSRSPCTPLPPQVDRQSYDELKPGVDRALALLDWFADLRKSYAAVVRELAGSQPPHSEQTLTLLAEALDCCVVLENQFSGWSQMINRFSWFKRTFAQIRSELSADVVDVDKLTRDLSRFQSFIGDTKFPIGMHMTGPLRAELLKVEGHERALVAALQQLSADADGNARADASLLRPLPYLIYLADGEAGTNTYNVFAEKLTVTQKVFKKHQMADCAPPPAMVAELGLPTGHPVHLGTVLARCPHYAPSMRTKWGMPKAADEEMACCVLL